jgi:transposase InsO family protein
MAAPWAVSIWLTRAHQLIGSLPDKCVAKPYVSIKYTERLAEAGIEPSVGNVGDCYDTALAETITGLYKPVLSLSKGPR